MHIAYNRHYNISFFGIERLHPFDSRKYGRAWRLLQAEFGRALSKHHIPVDRPVSDEELALVHSVRYLKSLRSPAVVAAALEIPLLQFLPGWLLERRVLRPMRWAVRGSVLAARAALENGWAVNLSGGYHHAKPNRGEGFCVFSDIALIVAQLRRENALQATDAIVYVDLDAHQGNGTCQQFLADNRVYILDMFNRDIYPNDREAQERINRSVALPFGCSGPDYLTRLRHHLPAFLDSPDADHKPRLAIYNAGTDVLAGDKLGGLGLSKEDVLTRDLIVIGELEQRQIPFVILLSGGYSQESHRLVARTVGRLLKARG